MFLNKTFLNLYILIPFSVLLFTGCSKKVVNTTNQNAKDSVLIIYSKTACFGNCPVYAMTIYENGEAILEGEKNIDKIGKYSLKLSQPEIDTLLKEFERAHFFELQDRYYKPVTDLPTTFITLTLGNKTKKITDYYGAPEKLKVLEEKIEEIVNKRAWKKLE
jgi:hypothetical protein